ncbi:hypothetical protein [Vibrio sp. TBV020]|uniref:hypothetical protein n=1 Tax=Vibrio sp. TBV020 TaxID=3137398 RepID=UPI0038CD9154
MSLRKSAREMYPKEYAEVAALGFKQSVKMLSYSMGKEPEEAFKMLCLRLERAEEQVSSYYNVGLPDYLVDRVLEILKQHQVPFGKHQLKPTKKVVDMWIKHKLAIAQS